MSRRGERIVLLNHEHRTNVWPSNRAPPLLTDPGVGPAPCIVVVVDVPRMLPGSWPRSRRNACARMQGGPHKRQTIEAHTAPSLGRPHSHVGHSMVGILGSRYFPPAQLPCPPRLTTGARLCTERERARLPRRRSERLGLAEAAADQGEAVGPSEGSPARLSTAITTGTLRSSSVAVDTAAVKDLFSTTDASASTATSTRFSPQRYLYVSALVQELASMFGRTPHTRCAQAERMRGCGVMWARRGQRISLSPSLSRTTQVPRRTTCPSAG